MKSYRESEVKANGIKGTTYSNLGGIGIGYQMPNGDVVQSGGNGYYYAACGSTGGLREERGFSADNGDGYINRCRGIVELNRLFA